MQTKDVTVRLQALDGWWEVGGVDRKRGIVPENVQLTSDGWGPSTASFDLRRDPRAIWPDLGAYTPVEVEVGGVVVWAGRVQQTPTSLTASDRVMSVQCQGWQAHLDDDLYEKVYVHTRMSDWQDLRGGTSVNLTALPQRLNCNVQDGQIVLGAVNGTVWQASTGVGVILDLGPASTARRVVLAVRRPAATGASTTSMFVRGSDTPDPLGSAGTLDFLANVAVTSISTTDTLYSGSIATGKRYVSIFLFNGTGYTSSADDMVLFKAVQVFADPAYENFNASILKASTVVTDALAQATVLLNTDRSQIAATSFAIPDFSMTGPQTPREVWSAVNAYHDYVNQIDVAKRPVFKPKPTAPLYEVGAWSPLEMEDQSANSGDDIYNRVIVTGTQPDGTPLRVIRSGTQSAPNPANELFVVPNAYFNGGTLVGGGPRFAPDNVTLTPQAGGSNASTVITTSSGGPVGPYEGTQSFLLAGFAAGSIPGASITASETLTGTFKAGRTYILQFASYSEDAAAFGGSYPLTVTFGTASNVIYIAGGWALYTISWIPKVDTTSPIISFYDPGGQGFGLDSVRVYQVTATIIDRRAFTRTKELPVSGALTVAAAQQIGDLWLTAHQTTPYKGSFKLTGDKAVRQSATGAPVKLETLLLHTGELIRDMAAIDPDTGGIGRDGRIAQVTYTPATEEAVVTLDNSRASFEALLARLDVITSVGK